MERRRWRRKRRKRWKEKLTEGGRGRGEGKGERGRELRGGRWVVTNDVNRMIICIRRRMTEDSSGCITRWPKDKDPHKSTAAADGWSLCTAVQRLSWNAGENCSGVFSRLKASVGKNGVRRTQSRKRTCGHTRRYITRNDTTHKRKRYKRWEEEGVREKTRERGWTQKLRKSRIMSGECLHCPLLICCCCFFQIQTEYLW